MLLTLEYDDTILIGTWLLRHLVDRLSLADQLIVVVISQILIPNSMIGNFFCSVGLWNEYLSIVQATIEFTSQTLVGNAVSLLIQTSTYNWCGTTHPVIWHITKLSCDNFILSIDLINKVDQFMLRYLILLVNIVDPLLLYRNRKMFMLCGVGLTNVSCVAD